MSSKIKLEAEDLGGEVDVARGRFESALHDLFSKDDESESENGSDCDIKDRTLPEPISEASGPSPRSNMILPTRPVRKRRRKETELRDGGFHHTYVMRMFDRSVDLAQFEESSPLYPICRAWMLNQPHNSDLSVKQEPGSPFLNDDFDGSEKDKSEDDEQFPQVTSLPDPLPYPESEDNLQTDPRIPRLLPSTAPKLNYANEESHVSPAILLSQHLQRWRDIRNQWKAAGQLADSRYYRSYQILKAMYEREDEKADMWNNVDDRRETVDETNDS